jgi:hypothetical protein
MTDEQLKETLEKDLKEKEMLEDFNPTDREPNATGGLTRTSYAMGRGPVLPSDEDPINPFQPKPMGPVLPDKSMMASDDMNERLLEQLYEQFLEEGFSPELAAEKARQLFDQMSKAKDRTGGRVQAASGGLAYILKV